MAELRSPGTDARGPGPVWLRAEQVARTRSALDAAGRLHAGDPGTVARLLLGALVRGSMLIAGSADPAAARKSVGRAVRALLAGFAPGPGE